MLGYKLITDAEAYFESEEKIEPKQAMRTLPKAEAPPIAMLGVVFDNLSLRAALARVEEMILARQPHYIATANVDFLVQARRDTELRRILLDAHLVLCDGMPLVWASRILGNRLPERVAGSDLAPELIRLAAEKNYRLFFLGATPESNALAIANVRTRFPNINIAGHLSPPIAPLEQMDHEEIKRAIRAARPDILLVAFGCPKAEKWMAMHCASLNVPVMIGVGATIDFLAGRVRRAPQWMQRACVEWAFRLWQEPRRLFRRYLTDFWDFLPAMAAQCWWMKGLRRSPAPPADSPFGPVLVQPTWLRLRVPERLDADAAFREKSIWKDLDGRHCLLDLDGVKFIDSTGVGMLLQLRKRIQAAGRCLVLLAPSPAAQRALQRMRAQNFFFTASDAMEARRLIQEQMSGRQAALPNFNPLACGASQ